MQNVEIGKGTKRQKLYQENVLGHGEFLSLSRDWTSGFTVGGLRPTPHCPVGFAVSSVLPLHFLVPCHNACHNVSIPCVCFTLC